MKKPFKAVEWMRARRRQIDEEDQGLSWADKRNRTHQAVSRDPVFKRLAKRVKVPATTGTAVGEAPGTYHARRGGR